MHLGGKPGGLEDFIEPLWEKILQAHINDPEIISNRIGVPPTLLLRVDPEHGL